MNGGELMHGTINEQADGGGPLAGVALGFGIAVDDNRPQLKVLVIGCGRSGTLYTATVLQLLGIDVGHELPGRNGMVSWWAFSGASVLSCRSNLHH